MINNGTIGSTYKKYSKILLLYIIILFGLSKNTGLVPWIDNKLLKYYIIPFLCIGVLLIIRIFIPKIHPVINITKKENVIYHSLIYAVFFILCLYLSGFIIYGFGRTPYDLTPRGIWLNFITVIIPFVTMETVRAYVIGAYCRNSNRIISMLLIIILMAAININWMRMPNLKDLEKVMIFISSEIGPEICKSAILSYFALYGGAIASIAYGGILLVFHWFFPFQPDLNWLGKGAIGMVIPVFELFLLVSKYENYDRRCERMSTRDMVSWLGTLILSVSIIWFVVGVFPVYPTVIVTGSMKPLIAPGDVVIANKLYDQREIEELKAGDIILFKRDNIIITHRIIEVIEDKKGNIRFRTKGDNNSVADSRLVLCEEVKGKYITSIPKLGYPTLWIKSRGKNINENLVN